MAERCGTVQCRDVERFYRGQNVVVILPTIAKRFPELCAQLFCLFLKHGRYVHNAHRHTRTRYVLPVYCAINMHLYAHNGVYVNRFLWNDSVQMPGALMNDGIKTHTHTHAICA